MCVYMMCVYVCVCRRIHAQTHTYAYTYTYQDTPIDGSAPMLLYGYGSYTHTYTYTYAHQDTPIDGSAPMLLYGYGSYGISMPASFSTNRISLLDRGFVYAIAHVRYAYAH